MRIVRFLPLALLLVPALVSARGGPPRDPAVARAIREVRSVRQAEWIVVGRVKAVHESPRIWCGTLATRQEVTYEVVETVAGKGDGTEVRVGHYLVAGSPLVVPDDPVVRPSMFYPGARILLLLNRDGESWIVRDEDCGARPIDPPLTPDPVTTALVRAVLDLDDLRAYLHPEAPERVPVAVLLTKAVPVPLPLTAFDKDVRFLPPGQEGDVPHLVFPKIEVEGPRAKVVFRYPVEGVKGWARLERKQGAWTVVESSVSED